MVAVSIALITDASPRVYPSSVQGFCRPIGAAAAISGTSSVGVGIGIIDIARAADMRGIMAAVVVVGVIIGEVAGSDRQDRPRRAATVLDRDHNIAGTRARLRKRLPSRCGIGYMASASRTHRHYASHQNVCEPIPTTHETTSPLPRINSGKQAMTGIPFRRRRFSARRNRSVTKSPNDEEMISQGGPLPNWACSHAN
jgi:hypothetical protein